MFNAFVWKLYKESDRGRKALERCSSFSDALHDGAFLTLFFGLSFDDVVTDYPATDPDSAELIRAVRDFAAKVRVDNLQQATDLFENLVSSGLSFRFSGGWWPNLE